MSRTLILTRNSHYSHLAQLQRLAATFRRPVTGIHNRTHGPIVDMLHDTISPLLPSSTTIPLLAQLRLALLSPQIRKVILIAHGTGSLPMNAAVDALRADLPLVCISKLEIYTFGAASRHMNNPLLVLDEFSRKDMALSMSNHLHNAAGNGMEHGQSETVRSKSPLPHWTRPDGSIASPVKATLKSLGHRVEDMERVITHVEHYAMAGDMVARCGVMDAVQSGTSRFAGRLFVLGTEAGVASMNGELRRDSGLMRMMGRLGLPSSTKESEMMTSMARSFPTCGTFQEYMEALFPLRPTTHSCLDTTPHIATSTAERREFIAQSTATPIMGLGSPRTSLGLGLTSLSSPHCLSPDDTAPSPRSRKEKRNSWGTAATLGIDGVGRARQGAREAEGRSGRLLRRLWRFEGGKVPCGMGVPVLNGAGMGGDMAGEGKNGGEGVPGL